MIQPPMIAPFGESKPPSVAAANEYTSTPPMKLTSRKRLRRDQHAGQRAERRREAPADHQRAPDVDPDEPADAGLAAAARIARPSLVRWKSRTSRPLTASRIATIPSDS